MRIVTLDELTEEMKLAREIIDPDTGRVLLGAGGMNLPKYAERLQKSGVGYVCIQDDVAPDVELPPTLRAELRVMADGSLKEIFDKLQLDQHPEYSLILRTVRDLLDEVMNIRAFLINVYELRQEGGTFIGHSVNVAVLSLLVGQSLGYGEDMLRKLGMGALLHDIGISKLPQELRDWRGSLTAEAQLEYQQHTVLGYNLVKESWAVAPLARGIILSHHEHGDGSGYPQRLLQGDIHEFSRIVGLVDWFEELTGGHPLSQKKSVREAVDMLQACGPAWYGAGLVNIFVDRIPIFQTGTTVHLSDGRRAVVISQNKGFPARPVVRVFMDQDGTRIIPGKEVNLLEVRHVFVDT